MTTCGSCGSTSADGIAACAKCGSPLGAGGAPGAASLAAEDERILREARDRSRVKSVRKSHAITGLITFFLINLLVGLPGSLHPLDLAANFVVSAVFGLPIGYLISARRGGLYRGALISAAALVLARLLLGIVDLARGAEPGAVLLGAFLWGMAGVLPGAIIGLHVEQDE